MPTMTNKPATAPAIDVAVPVALAHVSAIAVIDDAFRPLGMTQVPESDHERVLTILEHAEVLVELDVRGLDAVRARASFDEVLEALTLPDFDLGDAFSRLLEISADVGKLMERRHAMRQFAQRIRKTVKCEVVEFNPEDELGDIERFDVVFLDYYLDDSESDGTRAEAIAMKIQARRCADRHQQLVLMSSRESVRDMRTEFRRKARIEGAAYAFVAKKDMDEPWQVRAHLEMLSRAMPHSEALGKYIDGMKACVEKAREELSAAVDDLDIGDFAYIQRVALHEDGHPLGDYLSWLFSSHLTALAFEGSLRKQQRDVDAMQFEDGPLSPAEPSIKVANLYHDALFARNLGKLEGHPRDQRLELKDLPLVQLGDVFLDTARTKAAVGTQRRL